MRICFTLLLLVCMVATGQDSAVPDTPWFDHVKRPSDVSHEQLLALAVNLRKALKNKWKPAKIAELAPNEQTPRVIFITIGDDNWPGRTYFGTGFNFKSALQIAVDILSANEPVLQKETAKVTQAAIDDARKEGKTPPQALLNRLKKPGDWHWLRLDVVQLAKPVFGFSVENSRIALTSLVGIAFGPQEGFAFTPDTITGRCLLDDSRHIAKQQVVNFISETHNWPAIKLWLRNSAVDTGHRICLFETDSFYADGNCAVRLYRGHRLYDVPPDADACLAMATACANALARQVNADGSFALPFPAWESSAVSVGESGGERPDAVAEFIIALSRLAIATSDKSHVATATRCLKALLPHIKPIGRGGRAFAFSEKEELPEGSPAVPRDVSMLRTNALVCLALLELKAAGGEVDGGLANIATRLALHIKSQAAPGGGFYVGVMLPTGKIITEDERCRFTQVEDASIAALALVKAAKLALVKDVDFMPTVRNTLNELFVRELVKNPMESISLSPWLIEALSYAGRADKDFVLQLVKAGYAAAAATDESPLYPDYFGAVKRFPGCTLSAERSWFIGNLTRWLRENEKKTWAAEQLQAAMPILLFQTQAWLDTPASSILPTPALYRNFFRDNLEDYGFDLSGQVAQIISLVTIATELKAAGTPDISKMLARLKSARAATDTHPGPLTINLVLTRQNDTGSDTRSLQGEYDKPTRTTLNRSTSRGQQKTAKNKRSKARRKKNKGTLAPTNKE